jgi:hypothetical protein
MPNTRPNHQYSCFSLYEQDDEENFDLFLISSLETNVILCLGDDRGVPDYLITQLAKVLQQGSQLLSNESDDEYPPTPSSPTKPDGKSVTCGNKADSERMVPRGEDLLLYNISWWT